MFLAAAEELSLGSSTEMLVVQATSSVVPVRIEGPDTLVIADLACLATPRSILLTVGRLVFDSPAILGDLDVTVNRDVVHIGCGEVGLKEDDEDGKWEGLHVEW